MAPDAEPIVQAWLSKGLTSIRVTTAGVPKDPAYPLVTVSRVGSWDSGDPDVDAVDRPVLAVKSWARTAPEARRIASEVARLMRRLPEAAFVAGCKETNRYQSQDGDVAQYVGTYQLLVTRVR